MGMAATDDAAGDDALEMPARAVNSTSTTPIIDACTKPPKMFNHLYGRLMGGPTTVNRTAWAKQGRVLQQSCG